MTRIRWTTKPKRAMLFDSDSEATAYAISCGLREFSVVWSGSQHGFIVFESSGKRMIAEAREALEAKR